MTSHQLRQATFVSGIAAIILGVGYLLGNSQVVVKSSQVTNATSKKNASVLLDNMMKRGDDFEFCGTYGRFVFGRSGSNDVNEIEVLRVDGQRFTAEESDLIPNLQSLLILHLRDSQISEDKLRSTLEGGNLEVLVLENVQITIRLFDNLGTANRLSCLSLIRTGLSDDAILQISDNKNLRYLVLEKETADRVATRIFDRGNRRLRILIDQPRFYLPEFD